MVGPEASGNGGEASDLLREGVAVDLEVERGAVVLLTAPIFAFMLPCL
jgi:hypothetical protein